MAALLEGGLHGPDGFFATDEQRQDHVVEHYDIPNRQHRQQVGDALFAGGRCLFVAGGPLVPAGGFRRLAQGILQLGQHVFQRMVVLFSDRTYILPDCLQMSALADAVAAIVGDDHMVQKAQPHVDGQLPHGIGEDEVGTGGPRLAAGWLCTRMMPLAL